MLPGRTMPENWHPPVEDDAGKEETIRVTVGTVYSLNFLIMHDTEGRDKNRVLVMKPALDTYCREPIGIVGSGPYGLG